MADAFTVLRKDHVEVKAMLDELELGAPGTTLLSEEAREARKALVEKLIIEESKHEAAEEEYFWPTVRDSLADGDQLAEKAIKQEDEAKQVLHQLDQLSVDNVEFERLLTSFISDAREHISFEETSVWPSLQAAISAEQAQELGEKLEKAKSMGPTRPHPSTPASPGVLKTAGMAAAVTDRVRDAVSGRGKS